jgi:hypothetical protein
LLKALNQIFEEQKHLNIGRDFIEEPSSPEYSTLRSIDDQFLLFAVRED